MKYAVLAAVHKMSNDELADLAFRMAEAHPETFEQLLGVRYPANTFDVPFTNPLIRISLTAEQLNDIRNLAPTNKVMAIKIVREITGIGLKEAKDFIEIVILKK